MTPDQKITLDCLESVIMSPRQKGRIAAIRRAFREHKETLNNKLPWYKRLFKRFVKPRPS